MKYRIVVSTVMFAGFHNYCPIPTTTTQDSRPGNATIASTNLFYKVHKTENASLWCLVYNTDNKTTARNNAFI